MKIVQESRMVAVINPFQSSFDDTMMRRRLLIVIAAVLTACSSTQRYAASYEEVDGNRDGVIEWREFNAYFPGADPKAFLEADQNKDSEVTSEEWSRYTENHAP